MPQPHPEESAEELLADPEVCPRLSLAAPARAYQRLFAKLGHHGLPADVLELLRAEFLAECAPLERIPIAAGDCLIIHDVRWDRQTADELLTRLRATGREDCLVMIVPHGFRMQVADRETAEAYATLCGLDLP